MKVNTNELSKRRNLYEAPEITAFEMIVDSILCYSTERLVEDESDPWA